MDEEKDPGQLNVKDCFESLAQEARELYLPDTIQYIDGVPNPLDFYREYVCPNRPVIIRNAITHWPALHKWTIPYLRDIYGEKEVTVAVTPNGYADAVYKDHFVMPEERTMSFASFLDIMQHSNDLEKSAQHPGVFYIQKQNSNLTEEFPELIPDVEADIPWATETFGNPPDAVNFWMGQEKAITSMHKDHYENLYCVISGRKHFILLPPTDLPFIPYGTYPAAKYKEVSPGHFEMIDDPEVGQLPWIPIDPQEPDLNKWPCYSKAKPLHVTVNAGEMLYLPSLWFHHVRQDQATIAVNFWYDMEYDIKYNYFKFLENIAAVDKKL
ncbi:bifunctional peptidase and (3S)-lysyl hydroxylase JMJD7-like [Amphiura filiformis]|uniref:bifunctional peptidase and (3S)-lysyl hydroxylase JMJD7-like n=1 Tax=Amphiura filiformis TaxID=82378 RepID=UPI003B20FD4E